MRRIVRQARGAKRTSLAVALAFVVVLAGCSSDSEPEAATPVVTTSVTIDPAPTTTAPAISTTEPEASESDNGLGEGSWVATATGSGVPSYSEPDATLVADWFFPSPTQFDGPRVFQVIGESDDFYHVMIPVQPNGSTGWIPKDTVELSEVTFRAEIDLSDDSLTVWDGDEVIVQTAAATGKPSTPTPLGEFFVRDIIPMNSEGAYGSYILGLSGFSEALDSFAGAEPAIAIHGTNRPDLVGDEVSNGCIRIPNNLVELLAASVPLGTPVSIVA